jgi:hypothetical protein
MQFHTLFTVSISHTYYSQGCKDFSFAIPADSNQLLKNGKLIAKIYEGKLYVLFQQDETGQAVVPLAGKTLRFGLKLLNPFFSNFTDLSNFKLPHALYKNIANPDALNAAQAITFVGNLFSYELKKATRPVTVALKDRNNQVLQTDTVENDRKTVSYDFKRTNQAVGLYRIEESSSGNVETTDCYFDPELQQQNLFGVIEIAIANSFYTTPPEFAIAFTAKQETLKYYVIGQNYSDADIAQLSIVDVGESLISFTKFLPNTFTPKDIPSSLLGDSDAKIALFSSPIDAVKRQEKARQKIELRKNGTTLISHLPQPRPDRPTANLIVQLSKPKP